MFTLSIVLRTRDLTASTADYSLTATMVNVRANGITPVTVSAKQDGAVESSEEFEISIMTRPGTYTIGMPSTATVYIKDKPPDDATNVNSGKYFE